MYLSVIRQFKHTLGNLDAILTKAEAYAEHRKFDPNNYLAMRLAPDMLPFARQVQLASDSCKVVSCVLIKRDPPPFEDNEKTMAELHERVRKTLTLLGGLPEADYAKITDDQLVPVRVMGGMKQMKACDALLQRAMPNFYFHVTTAYDILRHAGVDIGKVDFLGKLNIVD